MSHQFDQAPFNEPRFDAPAEETPRAEATASFAGSYLELVFGTIDHAARARAD